MMVQHAIPHSVEAEQAVIGAVLIRPEVIDDIATLSPDHFYVAAHRSIYEVIVRMAGQGRQIDAITLAQEVHDAGLDDLTGGLAYIGAIAANVPSAANVKRYAKTVQDKAIDRQLLAAAEDIRAVVIAPGDTMEKLTAAQALIMAIAESRQQKQPRKIGDALQEYVATLERRHSGEVRGMSTGLTTLDHHLSGGLQDGNLLIVAGRPSMGKSAFTNTIAVHVAKAGNPTAIMSMEMTEIEQLDRFVATLGRVSIEDVTRAKLEGDAGDRIFAAVGQMQELPIFIDEEPGLSVHQVMAKARQVKRKHGLRLLIVDALGLMDFDSSKAVAELGQITKLLKGFAKTMGIPIILLCQLSRKVEDRTDKRPIMSDLRDSGAIEQDADVVMMLYRDEYYRPDSPDKGVAECLIRKNRQGKTGVVPLAFIAEQTRFEVLAGEWQQPITGGSRKPGRSRIGDD